MSKKEKPVLSKSTKKSPRKDKDRDILRQKILAKLILENRGKLTINKLMEKAGYSKAYAKNPQQLKKTLSWQELMEKNFSDAEIAKIEGEQLHASMIQQYVFSPLMTDEEIMAVIAKVKGCVFLRIQRTATTARAYFTTPDNNSIGKSLDRIYKMKLKYPKEKSEDEANQKLQETLSEALNRMKQVLPKAGV